MANNGAITLIVQAVRAAETGVATGMNTVIRQIGSALGTQIGAAIVAGAALVSGLPEERAYTTAFAVAAVAGLASALLAFAARPPTATRERLAGEVAA